MKRVLVLWADGCGNEMNVTRVAEFRRRVCCRHTGSAVWRSALDHSVKMTHRFCFIPVLFFRAKYFRGRKLNGEYEIRVEQVSWVNESSSRCSFVSRPESRRAPIASVALLLWTVVLRLSNRCCSEEQTQQTHALSASHTPPTGSRSLNGLREPGRWWLQNQKTSENFQLFTFNYLHLDSLNKHSSSVSLSLDKAEVYLRLLITLHRPFRPTTHSLCWRHAPALSLWSCSERVGEQHVYSLGRSCSLFWPSWCSQTSAEQTSAELYQTSGTDPMLQMCVLVSVSNTTMKTSSLLHIKTLSEVKYRKLK